MTDKGKDEYVVIRESDEDEGFIDKYGPDSVGEDGYYKYAKDKEGEKEKK